MKKTLVIGASENPDRYSNKAIHMLTQYGHTVVAVGRGQGTVAGVAFNQDTPIYENINTITLYVNPRNQEAYLSYIIDLKPERIIFNPGTENSKLKNLAEANGIETLEACTLVLLATGQY